MLLGSKQMTMKFEEVFANYDEEIDSCFNDYVTSDTVDIDTQDIIMPYNQQILSPPISMPSNSPKKELGAFEINRNESEIREDNFLRRMHQTQKEINCLPNSTDFQYQQMRVPFMKSEQLVQTNTASKVKMRLNSLSKVDQALQKRANTRRALKNSQRRDEEFYVYFRNETEDYSTDIESVDLGLCTSEMPQVSTSIAANNTDDTDHKFKFALKNMLPIPSISEQQIILDEYNSQLTQFSIAINRILRDEISDENCVFLLKLMTGMYTLLKTTLLAPSVYRELFDGVIEIEFGVQKYISNWSANETEKQVELFELAWWCESALPRAYLVCLLFASLKQIQSNPEHLSKTLSACKAIQHPLKGSFLYSHLHSFLKQIYFSPSETEIDNYNMQALCLGYSVETFTTLLRYFCRWHQSLPSKSTEPSYTASLYQETFSSFFQELARITSYDMFETVILPTILVEVVDCADPLAQNLIFTSMIKEFDSQYLLAQLGSLINSTSQFAQGIDLKGLLDQLFRKVQFAQTRQVSFFSTIWDETSKLIKNRCEIDQSDTVLISSLVLSLIVNTSKDEHVISITTVLDFLIKTLKTLRPEGFNSETSRVGAEIVHLIRNLLEEFEFKDVILKLANLPELLCCLKPASARKCCLNQIVPKLNDLNRVIVFPEIIKLFACFTKSDLTQLLGDDSSDTIQDVTEDLKQFTSVIINLLSSSNIQKFFVCIDNSSSCLNLFLIPELLEKSDFNPVLSRLLIASLLQNTSTVLSQRLEYENLPWIEPEFTKLMACKLNLRVIEVLSSKNIDPYDFYTEILTILNYHVSQDYLKIQIIENCLQSFTESRNCLQAEDFKCLLDHLFKEAGQLLRKSDRCKLLLKICEFTDNPSNSKYIDQVSILLNQLSEDPLKFDLVFDFLNLVMKEGQLRDEEVGLYQWAAGYVEEKDPSKEIQFYSIKLQYESQRIDNKHGIEDKEEECIPEYIPEYIPEIILENSIGNDKGEFEQTEEDLQKLKIFASFQI